MELHMAFNHQVRELVVELRRLGEILPTPEQTDIFTFSADLKEHSGRMTVAFHDKPQRVRNHIRTCKQLLDVIDKALGELWLKFGENKFMNDEVHRVWRLMNQTRHQIGPLETSVNDRIVAAAAS